MWWANFDHQMRTFDQMTIKYTIYDDITYFKLYVVDNMSYLLTFLTLIYLLNINY